MTKKRSKKLTHEEESEVILAMEKNWSKDLLKNIGIEIKCKTQNQKNFVNLIKEKEIIIASGVAGCGKTFLSCAEALKMLKCGLFKKIIMVKSVTTLKGEELGFLKGDLDDKVFNFTLSFIDNFNKIIGKSETDALIKSGYIEFLPLAFLRGRTIDSSFMICDEIQNISIDNMRTLMTRIGENSKMVLIGDQKQIDLKNKRESSITLLMNKFKNRPEFGIMNFEKCDQVRNPLINIIEDIFDELENKS